MCVCRWLAMLLLPSVLDAATSHPASTLSQLHFQPPKPASLRPSVSPALPSSLLPPSHSSLLQDQDINSKQQCTLMISPSELVVRFGDPLFANCSIEMMEGPLGWLVEPDKQELTLDRFLVLNFTSLTEWGLKPKCFVMSEQSGDCSSVLHLTVYKPPDEVSISFVNHTGPLLEGHPYTLQCRVQEVAPVQKLTVTFYKGDTMLGPVQSSRNSVEAPVTETFTFSFNFSREDDGVQYWCEAKLNLGPHGPALPLVMQSQTLKAISLRAKGTSNANSGHFIQSILLLSIQFIYWVSNHVCSM
ncbi:vascular cell adhesion protein 1-like [Gadus chalcogrammus]|uniref:vascular cell adhesion protein 1-like n=1 Tax=Gadus chalcogrammus TaxID=1042646 RepID=UPI0024C45A7A|nr:vascular cell adhesion protein 1-like [Gadus chalcogrammus]